MPGDVANVLAVHHYIITPLSLIGNQLETVSGQLSKGAECPRSLKYLHLILLLLKYSFKIAINEKVR